MVYIWGTLISSHMDATALPNHLVTTSPYKLKCNLDEAFRSAQLRRLSYSIRRPIISHYQITKLIAITLKHALTLYNRVSQAIQTRTTQFKTKWRPNNDSTIHSYKITNAITKCFKSSWEMQGHQMELHSSVTTISALLPGLSSSKASAVLQGSACLLQVRLPSK
jgi:hypothetical protein